ncbi:SIR2 family protein [Fonticella tunisiensis]|uniref:SIR2-like protein n=1 Tax=Fonticella tunisiensis TaxID=1096341 RepID=A0A4R7KAT0_9CLOT|nr:SIR2 family protein [Fonticella tunisiensis]TDT51121.1 SIR2-like protein [Fonticella tunisiensis]
MKTAIFLGAGASREEGIPVQNELFKIYFQTMLNTASSNSKLSRSLDLSLENFFKRTFNIDVNNKNLEDDDYPTFEEVIGILDIAEKRKENLKIIDPKSLKDFVDHSGLSVYMENSYIKDAVLNGVENKLIKLYLIILIAKVLQERLPYSKGFHSRLISHLHNENLLRETIFITTNYDILIDSAICSILPSININYGVDFINYGIESGWSRPDDNSIKIYKLHGSLNWLYCPDCNNLKLTKKECGLIHLVTDFSKAICSECGSIMLPVIVPPTYFKDMTNVFISTIWNKAENVLRDVKHFIFCGYSFCDSDIHIKYLLKRIQLNSKNKLLFTVLNNHPGKKEQSAYEEEKRYKRFLGSDVNYTNYSFSDFVREPMKFYLG